MTISPFCHGLVAAVPSRLTARFALLALVITVLMAVVAFVLLSPLRNAQPGAPITSLAVLPFASLGSDGDSDHLGIGIAADIITRISMFGS